MATSPKQAQPIIKEDSPHLVFSPAYNTDLPAFGLNKPFALDRGELVLAQLQKELKTMPTVLSPEPLHRDDLLLVHSPEYLQSLEDEATWLEIFELKKGKSGDDGMVELMPATRVSRSDADFIEKNQQVLLSNQHLIEKVLSHLGVPYYEPKLPKYRPLGANTILAVTDQIFYATAARKLGAPLPEAIKEQSGSGVDNNKFLHLYNNEILRSIVKKLGLPLPEPLVQSGSLSAFSHQVIVQNHEILMAIAKKLGVKP